MLSIIDYRLSEFRRTMKLSLMWLMFITFIILLFVLLQENMQICNYLTDFGYIDKEGYILVESSDQNLGVILNNDELIVNEKTYDYMVYKIENNFIYLKSNIPEYIKIENNVIDFKILLEKVQLFSYIFEMLRG